MTNELCHLRRNFVGHHGYKALAAKSDDGQRERVIAREDHKIFRQVAEHGRDLTDVARSLLDSDNVVDFRKPPQRGGVDICGRSAGHAIEDNWQRNRRSNRFVVLVESCRRGFVVVRGYRKDSVHAH